MKFFGKIPDTWGLFANDPKYHSKMKNAFWFLKLFSDCYLPSHSSRTCTLSPNNRDSWSGDEAVNEDIAWQKKISEIIQWKNFNR